MSTDKAVRTYHGRGIRLKVMPDRSLRYSYDVDARSSCEFSMLCEVGAGWQPGFKRMIAKLGLKTKLVADLGYAPWVADVLTNDVLPEVPGE